MCVCVLSTDACGTPGWTGVPPILHVKTHCFLTIAYAFLIPLSWALCLCFVSVSCHFTTDHQPGNGADLLVSLLLCVYCATRYLAWGESWLLFYLDSGHIPFFFPFGLPNAQNFISIKSRRDRLRELFQSWTFLYVLYWEKENKFESAAALKCNSVT